MWYPLWAHAIIGKIDDITIKDNIIYANCTLQNDLKDFSYLYTFCVGDINDEQRTMEVSSIEFIHADFFVDNSVKKYYNELRD